jgi:hypothetical protein
MRRASSVSAAAALAGALGAWPAPARAYILPAPDILEKVAERRAELSASTLVAQGYVPGTDPVVKVSTAIRPGRGLRTELRGPDGVTVELLLGRDRWRYARGAPPGRPERVPAAPLLALLGTSRRDPGGQRGRALLARMRVDPEVVSLARFDGRPVYVIGAGPGELDRPQLWIDKRYLVPVRWLVEARRGTLEDVRLYGYGQPTTGPWFPERIETWRGGERARVIVYTDAKINAPLERGTFAPPGAG